jgi:hypothetical protein
MCPRLYHTVPMIELVIPSIEQILIPPSQSGMLIKHFNNLLIGLFSRRVLGYLKASSVIENHVFLGPMRQIVEFLRTKVIQIVNHEISIFIWPEKLVLLGFVMGERVVYVIFELNHESQSKYDKWYPCVILNEGFCYLNVFQSIYHF